jgi:hypothetical protein
MLAIKNLITEVEQYRVQKLTDTQRWEHEAKQTTSNPTSFKAVIGATASTTSIPSQPLSFEMLISKVIPVAPKPIGKFTRLLSYIIYFTQ